MRIKAIRVTMFDKTVRIIEEIGYIHVIKKLLISINALEAKTTG